MRRRRFLPAGQTQLVSSPFLSSLRMNGHTVELGTPSVSNFFLQSARDLVLLFVTKTTCFPAANQHVYLDVVQCRMRIPLFLNNSSVSTVPGKRWSPDQRTPINNNIQSIYALFQQPVFNSLFHPGVAWYKRNGSRQVGRNRITNRRNRTGRPIHTNISNQNIVTILSAFLQLLQSIITNIKLIQEFLEASLVAGQIAGCGGDRGVVNRRSHGLYIR